MTKIRARRIARRALSRALDRVRDAAVTYPASGHELCLAVRVAYRVGGQRVPVVRRAMRVGQDAFTAAERAITGTCPHEEVAR
jgi:hypothetical protein